MSMFARATRQQVPLKLGITGPSGSGKTTAGLNIARGLVGPTSQIAFCDTENGSASLYADVTNFDVVNMNPPYSVAKFTTAIEQAVAGGYQALIIDSASAEWTELLAEKEAMDARGGNGFVNWGAITKKHEDFLKAIRNAPIHLILCLRAKQEHVQDKDDKGKTTIRKVGMAAVQRDGMEYELTTVFDLAMDHNYKVSKDRTRLFDGRMEMITVETGRQLAAWLVSGAPLAPEPVQESPATAQAPANPTPAPAASSPQSAPTGAPSKPPNAREKVQPMDAWTVAQNDLAKVTEGMVPASRAALLRTWAKADPEELPALLAEIATLRKTLEPKTVGAALKEIAQPSTTEIPQAVASFVDSVQPDTDEAAGGISPEQYEALGLMIKAHNINRDALRAYCVASGHLLPGRNGYTLARMKEASFGKLRDRILNQKPHPEGGTWSERTIKIINATPIPAAPAAA